VSVGSPRRRFALDPERWRPRPDGPRWLYAEPGRLRALWRLTVFGLAIAVAPLIVTGFIAPLFGLISRAVGEPVAAYPWITLVSVLASTALALRLVDDAPWSAVAMGQGSWSPRLLSIGLLLGSAAILATMALLWLTASARFETTSSAFADAASMGDWWATAARVTARLAPAALWEELLFRGYLWTVASDAGGVRVARWSTAVAFGAVHLLNPGAGVLSTLLVMIAGLSLGMIRERTNSMGATWLAHLAWNWIMAAVLHVPVSGLLFDTPLYRTVVSGPSWWTGGAWGPEGGVAALCVLVGALLWDARRRVAVPSIAEKDVAVPTPSLVMSATGRTDAREIK